MTQAPEMEKAAVHELISDEACAAGAAVLANAPTIDAPKLPPECWEGTVREILVAALPHLVQSLSYSGQWQPIETAPKNGHNILITTPYGVRIGFWDMARGGIWSIWPGRDSAQIGDFPTHWMPLPAAPPAAQEKAR